MGRRWRSHRGTTSGQTVFDTIELRNCRRTGRLVLAKEKSPRQSRISRNVGVEQSESSRFFGNQRRGRRGQRRRTVPDRGHVRGGWKNDGRPHDLTVASSSGLFAGRG